MRDVIWPNIRKTTTKKFDAARRTGGEGSVYQRLNDRDQLVVEILGKDSEYLEGIGIPESLEEETLVQNLIEDAVAEENDEAVSDEQERDSGATASSNSDAKITIPKPIPPKKRRKVSAERSTSDSDEVVSLKKQKLKLQVEQLEFTNYETQLKIWKLENELGIQHRYLNIIDPNESSRNAKFTVTAEC